MRILVVEDEPLTSAFVARGLKAERHAVDVCSDERESLDLIEAYSYDLLILDLALPQLGEGSTIRRIRRKDSSVPILLLSESNNIEDKVRLFDCGVDDYLSKPFLFAELLVRSKALMRRGPVNRSNTLAVGDLQLNRITRDVQRAGIRIFLTTKEFALLEYLMINQGRVLSRNMIVEHVWDQAFNGATNIVDVYVRHLRTKVDDQHARKLIRTIRNSGYSIRCEGSFDN
jgi:DNA-binding response OmpR family regulator